MPRMWSTNTIFVLNLIVLVSAKYKFFVVNEPATFAEAQKVCRQSGHFILTVKGGIKNQQAFAEMKKNHWNSMWIGITRSQIDNDEKPFQWVYDGIQDLEVRKTFWSVGEPNNHKGNKERCVEMISTGGSDEVHNWNDLNCNSKNPFICETY